MQSYDVLYIVSLINLFRQPAQLKEIRDALTLVWRHDIAYIVSLADEILVQLQIFHFVLALIATSGGDCAHHEGAVVNPRNVRMFRNHISRHLIKNKIELVVRLFIYFCLWTNEQSYLLFVNNNNAGLSTYSSSFWSFKQSHWYCWLTTLHFRINEKTIADQNRRLSYPVREGFRCPFNHVQAARWGSVEIDFFSFKPNPHGIPTDHDACLQERQISWRAFHTGDV